jgi:ubiquinone/menaquinone biosynthesis C-methylase UbiE
LSLELSNMSNAVPAGAAFDRIAVQYDDIFTNSSIGRAQRALVYRELEPVFHPGSRILELNCGTGEDALHFGARGVEVLACDASSAMIDVCREKMAAAGSALPVAFLVCTNENLDTIAELGPFDGALSNFGGLNCIADLSAVGRQLASVIRPGGTAFLCVMGRVCAWDIVWHVLRGQWGKAFRRLRSSGTTATVGGLTIRVHYPSVRQISRALAPWFRIESCRGIGIFVPPSWMEPFLRNRPRTLRVLEWLDRLLGGSALAGIADHVLLRFAREMQ